MCNAHAHAHVRWKLSFVRRVRAALNNYWLLMYLFIYLFICLFIYLFIYLFIHLFIYLFNVGNKKYTIKSIP